MWTSNERRGLVLRVGRLVAERALNHKIHAVEGIYDRHDCFGERKVALAEWAALHVDVANGSADGRSGPCAPTHFWRQLREVPAEVG